MKKTITITRSHQAGHNVISLDDTLIYDDCEIVGIKFDAEVNDFQAAIDYESRF